MAGPIVWVDPTLSQALADLRRLPGGAQVLDELQSDYLAAAFLTRHDLNLDLALQSLRKTLAWRQSSGVVAVRERLSADPPLQLEDIPHGSVIAQHLPLCEGGRAIDKRGLPYGIRCLGVADFAALCDKLTEDDMLEWQLYISERRLLFLEAHARRTGCLGDVTIIQDAHCPAGLIKVWRTHGGKVGIMYRVTKMVDEHYPGVMGAVFLVNAPWVLHAILKVVRPVLPERVSKIIEVLPAFKTQERLLEVIDAENLPKFLGGNGADEDFCPSRKAVDMPSGLELNIPAGKQVEQTLFLEEKDVGAFGLSVADGYDINFTCSFVAEAAGGGTVEVQASSRVESSEMGSFTAPCRGKLVLTFDNTYSWVNAKKVQYELTLIPAGTCSPPSGDKEAPALLTDEASNGLSAQVA